MYIDCGRLSIIITEGQMRIFLMTPVGVVVTTRGRERVKMLASINNSLVFQQINAYVKAGVFAKECPSVG